MFACTVLFVGILSSVLANSTPMPDRKELMAIGAAAANKCLAESKCTMANVEEAGGSHGVDPCFTACCMKESKFMDEKGMIQSDKFIEVVASEFKDKPTVVDKFKAIAESCSDVNDKMFADGDKGCERAIAYLECLEQSE